MNGQEYQNIGVAYTDRNADNSIRGYGAADGSFTFSVDEGPMLPALPRQSATPKPQVVSATGTPTAGSGNGAMAGGVMMGAVATTEMTPMGWFLTGAAVVTVGAIYASQADISHPDPAQPWWGNGMDQTYRYQPPVFLNAENKTDHLRGGKQNQRDSDIKQYPRDFQRWYHKEVKPYVHPGRDATPEELKEAHEEWIQLGKPIVK